jgi:hypothetical protein
MYLPMKHAHTHLLLKNYEFFGEILLCELLHLKTINIKYLNE